MFYILKQCLNLLIRQHYQNDRLFMIHSFISLFLFLFTSSDKDFRTYVLLLVVVSNDGEIHCQILDNAHVDAFHNVHSCHSHVRKLSHSNQ